MAHNNPFYSFNDQERPAFVQFDRRLQTAWLERAASSWMMTPGLIMPNVMPYGAAEVRMTIPTALLEFAEKKTDTVFAELSAKERSYKWGKKYELAVSEDAEKIARDDFTGWPYLAEESAVVREDLWISKTVAVFNDNPTGWDGLSLFHATHLNNLVDTSAGTQSNITGSSAYSATNLRAAITLFNGHKNLRGGIMGWEPDTIIFGTDIKESVLRDVMPGRTGPSSSNATDEFRGRFKNMIYIPQLTTGTDWFLAKLGGSGMWAPIVRSIGNGGDLERIAYGQDSELFRNDQKLGMKWIERLTVQAGLYQAIHKFQVAAL
jgi:hypothetical protein